MKILGINRAGEVILKPDSALVVNRKPFFCPTHAKNIVLHPCIVVRLSRLGKNIEERFADRYYDAVTRGLNIEDCAQEDYIKRWAFDNSLIVGEFLGDLENLEDVGGIGNLRNLLSTAIAKVSSLITIRMGDMLFIDLDQDPIPFEKDKVITATIDQTEVLYCKLK